MNRGKWISICTKTGLLIAMLAFVPPAPSQDRPLLCGTPFIEMCSHTTRTQWLAEHDIVVLAKLTKVMPPFRGCEEEYGSFEIVEVLKGAEVPAVRIGGRLDNLSIRDGKPGDVCLLYSTAPPKWHWWNYGRLTADEQQHYLQLQKLPKGSERLAFFFDYLEESGLRGDDARDEFHNATYRQLRELKPLVSREKIVERLKPLELGIPGKEPRDRQRQLYAVLLGICGNADDVPWFEAELKQVNSQQLWREAYLLAGYLSLAGEKGLPLVVDSYLNQDGWKTTAAYFALCFVAAHTDAVPRARLAKIFRSMRERKELDCHELIGLAHCHDWSELENCWTRFERADAEQQIALRTSIIRYLRKCPLEEATVLRQKCEQLDPQAAKQANLWNRPLVDARSSSMPAWEQELLP